MLGRALPLSLLTLLACDPDKSGEHTGAPSDDTGGETGDDSGGHDTDDTSSDADADGDGYLESEDCDDADATVNPGATDACGDSVDNDCDGGVDNDDDQGSVWYSDSDGDGYGDDASATTACEQPEGTSSVGGDCEDGDGAYNPGVTEDDCADPNDYNCDGSVGYVDADGDGAAACEDCDDADAGASPTSSESCDGVDNDCDGEVDEDDATDALTWYADGDGDGAGDASSTATACSAPEGYVGDSSDCDDTDGDAHPGAEEVCGGGDEDCDGEVDEDDASDAGTWYKDGDGDGYGDADSSVTACETPAGYAEEAGDCDDGSADASPTATELCNGLDDDSDGETDEADASDTTAWYGDGDGDGYGDAADETWACEAPEDTVADSTDCDDADPEIHPDTSDVCGGVDEDCDGDIDEDVLDGATLISSVSNVLYALDSAGTKTTLSTLDTTSLNVNGLTSDLETGVTIIHSSKANDLTRVDVCTGATTYLGATGVGNCCGVAFGPDGALYGIDTDNDDLVTFNAATGAGTKIGDLGFDLKNCALAYDCTNDRLIGMQVTSGAGKLFTIDASTGAATDWLTLDTSITWGSAGLEVDPGAGTIYATTDTGVYSVNPSTGAATLVSSLGTNNLTYWSGTCD